MSPATVATASSFEAVAHTHQRKSFYAAGRFWAFYTTSPSAYYESSTDGVDWSGGATSIGVCVGGIFLSVWYDGTYVHYARYYDYDLYYRRGTPESNGTITWSAAEQTVYNGTETDYYWTPCITVDSGGYAWIGVVNRDDDVYTPYVLKNANNNGTWSTHFAAQLSATGSSWEKVGVVPLTSGKIYAIFCRPNEAPRGKLYDAGWGGVESDLADYDVAWGERFCAVADGDDVHFVYTKKSTYQIRYNKRTFGTGWGANDVLVQNAVTSTCAPALSFFNSATGDLFCFWTSTATDRVYYKKCKAAAGDQGSWDADPTDWIADDMFEDDLHSSFYQDYDNKIGLLYLARINTTNYIRFKILTPLRTAVTTQYVIIFGE